MVNVNTEVDKEKNTHHRHSCKEINSGFGSGVFLFRWS